MIDKLDEQKVLSMRRGLIINEKYAEFLIAIYRKKGWGSEIAKRFTIIPSSKIGMGLSIAVLRRLGFSKADSDRMIFKAQDYNKKIAGYDIEDWLLTPDKEIIENNDNMKFDVIIANPPFSLGDRMLEKWFGLLDDGGEIVTVQPSTWLLGKKQKKGIVDNVEKCESADFESIIGNEWFDAGIAGQIAIQHFVRGVGKGSKHNGYYINFDGKKYQKCSEIKAYSNDTLLTKFETIITPLYTKDNLQNHIKSIPNVHVFGNAPEEHNPKNDWYIFRLTRFSIHPDGTHTNWCIVSKNNLVIKQYKDLKNITEKNGNQYLKYYVPFTNKYEAENLLKYTETFFCRCCLYLIQTSYELGGGECRHIPWFDFSDPMFDGTPEEIDNTLFAKFNVNPEIVRHLLELLPNYYNLDLNKYNI